MQYSFVKACLLALATASGVTAQTAGFDVFTSPSTPGASIAAGSDFTITWEPSAPAGKISIILLQGSSNTTLETGPTIASGIDSVARSYDWMVPTDGTNFALYGLKIQLDSDPTIFQYSTYFEISGISASSTTGGSTTTLPGTTITVSVSQVSPIPSSNSSTSAPASSTSGLYSNTTVTTTTSTRSTGGAASIATSTSASPSATKSGGAMSSVTISGTGLLGALIVSMGMLL